MTNMRRRTPDAFETLEATGDLRADSRTDGRPVEIAANYVIFRPDGDGTFIAADPQVVAHARENGRAQEWVDVPAAAELHELILGEGATRTRLRTANKEERAHSAAQADDRPG
jgi:hypothetical protein